MIGSFPAFLADFVACAVHFHCKEWYPFRMMDITERQYISLEEDYP